MWMEMEGEIRNGKRDHLHIIYFPSIFLWPKLRWRLFLPYILQISYNSKDICVHDLNLFITVNDIHEHAQVEGKHVSRMVKSQWQHEIYFLNPMDLFSVPFSFSFSFFLFLYLFLFLWVITSFLLCLPLQLVYMSRVGDKVREIAQPGRWVGEWWTAVAMEPWHVSGCLSFDLLGL